MEIGFFLIFISIFEIKNIYDEGIFVLIEGLCLVYSNVCVHSGRRKCNCIFIHTNIHIYIVDVIIAEYIQS